MLWRSTHQEVLDASYHDGSPPHGHNIDPLILRSTLLNHEQTPPLDTKHQIHFVGVHACVILFRATRNGVQLGSPTVHRPRLGLSDWS